MPDLIHLKEANNTTVCMKEMDDKTQWTPNKHQATCPSCREAPQHIILKDDIHFIGPFPTKEQATNYAEVLRREEYARYGKEAKTVIYPLNPILSAQQRWQMHKFGAPHFDEGTQRWTGSVDA